MAYGCSNRIAPKTRDKMPIENIAIRPAFRMGRYGELNARAPRIPLTAKAPTIRKTPSETIVAASDAVRPMPVVVEMHNVGDLNLQRDVVAVVEHVLSGRMGDWRVLIVGSQESDRWEMK